MPIKHAFTSPKSDGADATIVRPSDWNADHIGEGWEDAISDVSGIVHRWTFEETSGYPQDVVGTLHMTTGGGTITREVSSPVGNAFNFTDTMTGSGQGDAPDANETRTIIAAWRSPTSSLSATDIVDWGATGTARVWNHLCANHDGTAQLGILFWSDDHKPNYRVADGRWHLIAARYSARAVGLWVDGSILYQGITGGNLATGSGTLQIGHSVESEIADLIISTSWVAEAELQRLWDVFRANL